MLRPLLTLIAIVLATLATGWIVDQVLQRIAARHREAPVWELLRRCRIPLQLVVLASLLLAARPFERLFELKVDGVHHALLLLLIGSTGWLAVTVVAATLGAVLSRYETVTEDASRVQRVRTQIDILRRVVSALIAVVTVAVMLLTFSAMRAIGTSLLASAAIVGVVAGIAAQSTLGNFFAGLQIAFSDTVRIGDTVVVETQMGTVEEITLSYLVVRLWDYRRLIIPVSYFVSRPFENWTRRNPSLLAWVMLHLDHTTPVDELRTVFHEQLQASSYWDGAEWSLRVVDTTPSTVVIRAAATARNPDDTAALRFEMREHLIAWLRDHYPSSLPRIRTGEPTAPK